MEDNQIAHYEDKQSKVRVLDQKYTKLLQELYGILARRNSFSPKPESENALATKLQSITSCSDLAALIDILEKMGHISRLDFTAQCVERLQRTIKSIESPNSITN